MVGTDHKAAILAVKKGASVSIYRLFAGVFGVAGAVLASGCGHNMEQRAATGAVAGLIVAGPAGAAVGAVAGAAVNEVIEAEQQ